MTMPRKTIGIVTGDPIDNIEWIPAKTLTANSWNPNRVHKNELRLLELSILSVGYVQPILIDRDNGIIDGFHRWRLASDSVELREHYAGKVPCARLDVDRPTAMAITVRMNRAKGSHVAIDMSVLVKELVTEHGWSTERVGSEIGADKHEVALLMQEGVFSVKNTKDHAYSKAWYPERNTARS